MNSAGVRRSPVRDAAPSGLRGLLLAGFSLSLLLPIVFAGLVWYELDRANTNTIERARVVAHSVQRQLGVQLWWLADELQERAELAAATAAATSAPALPTSRALESNLDAALHDVVLVRGGNAVDLQGHPADASWLPPSDPDARPAGLSIGPPLRDAATGRVVVPVAWDRQPGLRLGARIDDDWFAAVLVGYDLGAGSMLNLLHRDRVLLARSQGSQRYAGTRLDRAPLFDAAHRDRMTGEYVEASLIDGVQRQFVFLRIPHSPLIVVVGSARRDMLASWRWFAALALGASVLLGLLWWWLSRAFASSHARQGQLLTDLRAQSVRAEEARRIACFGDWAWNLDTGEVAWSDELFAIYGLPPRQGTLRIEEIPDWVHPDDRERLRGYLDRMREGGEPLESYYRIVRPDGAVRVIYLRGEWVDRTPGQRVRRGIQQDVTELANVRERLREAEDEYRFLFERNPLPMCVYDRETLVVLAVNEAMTRHYGYTREELLAATVLNLRPPAEVEAARTMLLVPSAEYPQGRVWTHSRKDGTRMRMLVFGHEIEFDGHPARLVLAQDVTEQERNEQRFQLVARATSDAIWDWDIVTNALWWSDSFYTVFGYGRDEIEPTLESWETRIHPDDRARVVAGLHQAIESGDPEWQDNYRFLRNDGNYAEVVDRGFVLRDADGRAVRAAGGMLDQTEKLRSEAELRLSEQRFQLVARATSDAIWDWDLETDITWRSDNVYPLFGYERDEIGGTLKGWAMLLHPDDRQRVVDSVQHTIDSGASEWECTYRFLRKDGSYADVLDRGFILRDENGHAFRAVGGMLDITQKHQDEANLRLLRRAMESADNGIAIADARLPGMPVVYVNRAYEKMTGSSSAELLGSPCRFLQEGPADQPEISAIRQAIAEQRELRVLLHDRRKSGEWFWNDFYLAPVLDDAGTLTHFVSIQSDVSERQRILEQLAHQATYDELTGLPNRYLLADRLQQAVHNAERHRRGVGVLFVDLDEFKLINDTLGHSAGDEALRTVAQRFAAAVRGADTVGRFGGDEFVAILTEQTDEDGVGRVIERISAALAQPVEIAGVPHYITASIGYCRFPESGKDAETLLKHADLAMYQAKQQGRNRAVAYRSEFNASVSERLHMVSALRDAMLREEFRLVFQPLFGWDGVAIGMEALLRWQHPERGLLAPGQFIGVCEDSGLIVPIGRWVLHEAARHHARLVANNLGHLRIAVNVSAVQFQTALYDDVQSAIAAHALPHGALELELTESVIMANPDAAIEIMRRIDALGVSISVDDFGTGYSSLTYLKRLPIDHLKIDRSFVDQLGQNSDDDVICTTIITLAHSLGLSTVAEGVETRQQLEWLRAAGCDEFQGYLLGYPLPFDEMLLALAASKAAQQPPIDPVQPG